VTIKTSGGQTCISSNGIPTHSSGPFRGRNSISSQKLEFCFDASPTMSSSVTHNVPVSGVSLSGIPFRPGTAEYYDASSPRGFSRDRSSGWNVEGLGNAELLHMDSANAHVDQRGLYHYHGPSAKLVDSLEGTQVGYAADGFAIHYVGDNARSSWQLKSGTRPSGPGGRYDGTYVEDWEFVAGSGNLDECNGAMLDGEYVYFATDAFPYFPRCFKGTVSRDFKRP